MPDPVKATQPDKPARFKPLVLPEAPGELGGPVKVWRQPVIIPTFEPAIPDRNPMFLHRRVYQGSGGGIYPLPLIDRISSEPINRSWDAVHLENQYLRLMVLPELGGRIHVAVDRTNGYDFIYRQDVIKPGLVGLAGPWVSGGIEFNWPQHHRPGTYTSCDVSADAGEDGSITVWMSDHDPMLRMKGMHGIRMHPGRSVVELVGRLYNRTRFTHSFLWWANVAVKVGSNYESFFPPDVSQIADNARRAVSSYPLCDGKYYGIDYAARDRDGVPASEIPARHFPPPDGVRANDLRWYANIPVPTAFMCLGSEGDFFGGYDHDARAGIVHVANHFIAPGKKLWTWGNHEFGYAWGRNLSEPPNDPYIELMAGVFTDNQPDYSHLGPGETKTFRQFWYPIREIGPAVEANVDAAVRLTVEDDRATVGVAVTGRFDKAVVSLAIGDRPVRRWNRDLSPESPLLDRAAIPPGTDPTFLNLTVTDRHGRTLIHYRPKPPREAAPLAAAVELPPPAEIGTADELYFAGVHLQQYRHATRRPEDYWTEALRRDSADARCNNAMGSLHLRRGLFESAEKYFRASIARSTALNPNPIDGEPFYNLGLALVWLGRDAEAYGAFYKSTWNAGFRSAGYHAIGEIDARAGRWETAIDHLELSLKYNHDNLRARNLLGMALRNVNRTLDADDVLRETLSIDKMDSWCRHLLGYTITCDTQTRLDLALDYTAAGDPAEAIAVLKAALPTADPGTRPLIAYYLADLYAKTGNPDPATEARRVAAAADPAYCFPARLEEIGILERAIAANPDDSRAPYYLGNLYYDYRRYDDAIPLWEKSVELDGRFATSWRNLGIAYFNVSKDPPNAKHAYSRAVAADPHDARLLYEQDQLFKQLALPPGDRLANLQRRPDLVSKRDDLAAAVCDLLNQLDRHDEAAAILYGRKFQAWEGGEGRVLAQHVRTCLGLGWRRLKSGDPAGALVCFENSITAPPDLGEARHMLANQSDCWFWIGHAAKLAGKTDIAGKAWTLAANFRGDFQDMAVQPYSEMTLYSALSLGRLGRAKDAEALASGLGAHADMLRSTPVVVDYFATSLPELLLFDTDLQAAQTNSADVMAAGAEFVLGRFDRALKLLDGVLSRDPNHAVAADTRSAMLLLLLRSSNHRASE